MRTGVGKTGCGAVPGRESSCSDDGEPGLAGVLHPSAGGDDSGEGDAAEEFRGP